MSESRKQLEREVLSESSEQPEGEPQSEKERQIESEIHLQEQKEELQTEFRKQIEKELQRERDSQREDLIRREGRFLQFSENTDEYAETDIQAEPAGNEQLEMPESHLVYLTQTEKPGRDTRSGSSENGRNHSPGQQPDTGRKTRAGR